MKGVSTSKYVPNALTPCSPEELVSMVPQPHTGCSTRSRPMISTTMNFSSRSVCLSTLYRWAHPPGPAVDVQSPAERLEVVDGSTFCRVHEQGGHPGSFDQLKQVAV